MVSKKYIGTLEPLKKIVALVIIAIFCFESGLAYPAQNFTVQAKDTTTYLLIKADDVGDNLSLWKWFYDTIQSDSRFKVDLGIIASRHHAYPDHERYIKENILNNPQFGIFNHGWIHDIPEFQNQSYYYMYTHIAYWDYYMKTVFNYVPSVKVLGAPGNAIGNTHDCSLDLYSILAQLNYKILYFSYCEPIPGTGQAGGNLAYINFEENLKPRPLSDILNDFNKLQNYKFVYAQIHPAMFWNATYLKYILTNVFTDTDRQGIRVADYYTNFFLPVYPNYFLENPSSFLGNRTNVESITISTNQYQLAFNSISQHQSLPTTQTMIKNTSIYSTLENFGTLYFDSSLSLLTAAFLAYFVYISFFKRKKKLLLKKNRN